jgi:hypothetical protein
MAALLAAVRSASPYVPGALLAVAMLGRPNVVLLWPAVVGLGISRRQGEESRATAAWWMLRSLIPVLGSIALLLAYNALRFRNPLQFGYSTEGVQKGLQALLQRYGQFSTHFLARNLWTAFVSGPVWNPSCGRLVPNAVGMSVFLTTPALLWLVRAHARRAWVAGCWCAVVLSFVPFLMYYNTGWVQFGYRFSLDLLPPVMLLLALAVSPRSSFTFRAAVVLSVLVNAWGVAWWFGRWC